MSTTRPFVTRRAAAAALLGLAALLGACTTVPGSLSAEAASAGRWPADRAPGRYAFDRLPSLQTGAPVATPAGTAVPAPLYPDAAQRQGDVERLAAAALARAGFTAVTDPAQAEVLVQVGLRVLDGSQRRLEDAEWERRVQWRLFFGTGWTRGPWSSGVGWSFGLPASSAREDDVEVMLLLRDRTDATLVHELRARKTGRSPTAPLVEALFDAALKDFPKPSAPREVTVPWPASPASAPAR